VRGLLLFADQAPNTAEMTHRGTENLGGNHLDDLDAEALGGGLEVTQSLTADIAGVKSAVHCIGLAVESLDEPAHE
jgi:hypothetical protein